MSTKNVVIPFNNHDHLIVSKNENGYHYIGPFSSRDAAIRFWMEHKDSGTFVISTPKEMLAWENSNQLESLEDALQRLQPQHEASDIF